MAASAPSPSPTRVRTPKFRVSFPDVFKPTVFSGSKPKFRLTALFPKDVDLSALKAAAMAAVKETWGDKPPKGLKTPFKDGDLKSDLDGYAGHTYLRLTANEDRPPLVIDGGRRPITNPKDLYAGCYAYATVNAYTYDREDGKGVTFSFDGVQFAGHGEPFGAKGAAPEDFEVLSDEDPIL